MTTLLRFRVRWFELALRFFAAGALASVFIAALVTLPQVRILAAVALMQAVTGVAVCLLGMRIAETARWNALRMRMRAFGHRLRQRARPAALDTMDAPAA